MDEYKTIEWKGLRYDAEVDSVHFHGNFFCNDEDRVNAFIEHLIENRAEIINIKTY